MHLVSALNLIYCRYVVLKFNFEQRYYQHPVYNHNKVVAKSEFLRTYFFQLAVNIFCFIRFIAVGTQFGLLRSSWKKKSALVGESSKFQSTSILSVWLPFFIDATRWLKLFIIRVFMAHCFSEERMFHRCLSLSLMFRRTCQKWSSNDSLFSLYRIKNLLDLSKANTWRR